MDIYSECELQDIIEYWRKIFPELKDTPKIVEFLKDAIGLTIQNQKIGFQNESIAYQFQEEILLLQQRDKYFNEGLKGSFSVADFYSWVGPIVEHAINSLSNRLQGYNGIQNIDVFLKSRNYYLVQSLSRIMMRTLVFEINYRKEQGDPGLELLSNFYAEYEVLYYLLMKEANNYVDFIMEIIDSTLKNKKLIESTLFHQEIGDLIDIDINLGDRHCNGKTVAILVFEKQKVIYKPRSLKTDISFQNLLTWINSNLHLPYPLKTMKIVDGGECGWCEYIQYEECKDEKLKEFYYKMGTYLFIMYLLNATDMHYENMIVNRENPMFIDLESLFTIQESKNKEETEEVNEAVRGVMDKLKQSINTIGLLPHTIKTKNGEIEVGGIGNKKEQIAPIRSLKMVQGEEDTVHLEYTNAMIEGKKNAPKENENLNIQHFIVDIVKGFTEAYRNMLLHKTQVLEVIENLFSDVCVRVILKPTVAYGNILQMSLHPDFLQDYVSRLILLSRIGLYDNEKERNADLLQSEICQLFANQIPYYKAYFAENEVIDGCTNKVVYCREKTAKQALEEKFASLCMEDMVQQSSILQSAFYKRNNSAYRSFIQNNKKNEEGICDKRERLKLSKNIADYIMLRSCVGYLKNGQMERRFWGSNVLLIEDDNWRCTLDSLELYDGNAGIALMLFKLWEKTKEEKYRIYMEQSVESIREMITNYGEEIEYGGFFKGLGGYIYLFAVLNRKFEDHRNQSILDKLLSLAERLHQEDKSTDFVLGEVGLIAGLLYYWKYEKNKKIKMRILKIAQEHTTFIEKKVPINLSGFAHGYSGVLPVIYKLYQITSANKYLTYVQEIIDIERKQFWMPEEKEWKMSEEKKDYAYGWCHGSPGILLGKTLLYQMGYRDEQIEAEMKVASDNVIKKGLRNQLCLCHGDLGNISILKFYSKIIDNHVLYEFCETQMRVLCQQVMKEHWKDYEFEFNKYNGLMIGLSGVVVVLQSEILDWL